MSTPERKKLVREAKKYRRDDTNSQSKRRAKVLKWRKERKAQLWNDCENWCELCDSLIFTVGESELDHKIPVRRGGDTDENTHLTHRLGNQAKGSRDLETYLKLSLEQRRKQCGLGER